MGKLLTGAFLAAVACFMFGFLWWGFLAMAVEAPRPLPVESEAAIASAVRDGLPESGAYFYPLGQQSDGDEVMEIAEAKHQEGPVFQIFVRAGGGPMMDPRVMVNGFFHMFVVALFAGVMLRWLGRALVGYGSRVLFVTLLGAFAGTFARLGDVVWWYHPLGYELFTLGYYVLAALVIGLVLAKFVGTRRAEE